MHSDTGNTTSLVLGFPIRTPSDQRSVGSSPRHIAASHVLHRPLMPRHPPCALKHLQHNKPKKKESKKLHHNKPPRLTPQRSDARNHYPQIKHHTPPPRWSNNTPPTTHSGQGQRACCLRTQQCARQSQSSNEFPRRKAFIACAPDHTPTTGAGHPTNRPDHRTPTRRGRAWVSWCSLERR